ncbi:Epoxide hydrolase 4-like 2, partial [Homarus americanus]
VEGYIAGPTPTQAVLLSSHTRQGDSVILTLTVICADSLVHTEMGDVRKYLVFVFVWGMSLATSLMVVPWLLWLRWKVGKEVFSVKPRPTPPPALKDSKWGSLTHTYMDLKTQGVKLHYVEAGDHNNPLMVFLHGFPECWFSWRHQLKYFSENYWYIFLFQMPWLPELLIRTQDLKAFEDMLRGNKKE